MNYYIQGNAANADQIKAAFEKLGYDTTGHLFNANSVLYFTLDGGIRATTCNCTPAIIKTHPDYQELELPVEPKFKVGNWVVSTRNQILTYRILEPNISNELGKLDYKVEIYSDGIYEKTCLIPSSKMDEWGRLWTIADANDCDVLATDNGWACIFKAFDGCTFSSYCFMDSQNWFCEFGSEVHTPDSRINGNIHPATKEQRDLMFTRIREAGYEWDADKKELNKIQPHYDIANFKPFDKVLVRCGNDEEWMIEFYCKYDTLVHTSPHRDYPFMGIGDSYSQCIPFEGNEHLLGTTDMCPEEYINW